MIGDFFNFILLTISGIIGWCIFLVLSGLLLRINWEILMFGWRLIG